jgi:hypothetical protein
MRLLGVPLVFVFACASTSTSSQPPSESLPVGYWDSKDAFAVADELIAECMKDPWVKALAGEKKSLKQVGIVMKTDQRIVNPDVIAKAFERALLNSGLVRLVGHDAPADYTLQTAFNTQGSKDKTGNAITAYQVSITVVGVADSEIKWMGTKTLRKIVEPAPRP